MTSEKHLSPASDSCMAAEAAIVALCAEDPSRMGRVELDPVDICSLQWRAAWTAMLALRQEHGDAWDALAVCDLCPALSPSSLTAPLVDCAASQVERHAEIITQSASKRRLLLGVSRVQEMARSGSTVEEMATAACLAVSDAAVSQRSTVKTVGDIVKARYHSLAKIADDIAKGRPNATGISTGLDKLDEVLGGLQRGIVTLLAARPGMGKSTLALNITNAASAAGSGVHVFSLEDTEDAYADRVLSMGSKISSEDIRSCKLSASQLGKLGGAGERALERKGWIVDDRSAITAEEVVRSARMHMASNGTQLVIVDYIQLLRGAKGQDTRTMLSRAINDFGDAAKRDDMAYLVLSQLNRGLESRDDKRPRLSDLKECGTLEERAKACIMLYRGHVYDESVPKTEMELLVRKNSNGRTGTAMVSWHPESMRIR